VAQELGQIKPSPPALRIFDAGMGDGTVLARVMRGAHRQFQNVPLLAVAKEISLEDVRLGLDKMPDRFLEHPATVVVVTNLNYTEAPRLMLRDVQAAAALNWHEVRLTGSTAHEYGEQRSNRWGPRFRTAGRPDRAQTGNLRSCARRCSSSIARIIASCWTPSYRSPAQPRPHDLIVASQPWRARMSAAFKTERVLTPLTRSLAPGGRLLAIQSYGRDPGLEIVNKLWPDENPFKVDRHDLLRELKSDLGRDARDFVLSAPPDDKSLFRYEMHTLPSEIGDRIGTSTLFAAWNAAIYVNQIEDERLDAVVHTTRYLEATQEVLQAHGGLWFNDESFVVVRRRP
jgi:hypothetical protein